MVISSRLPPASPALRPVRAAFDGRGPEVESSPVGERDIRRLFERREPSEQGLNNLDAAPTYQQLPVSSVKTALSSDGKSLYAAAFYQNKVMAIDLASGEKRWERELQNASNPQVGPEGNVYVSSYNGFVALNPKNGVTLWGKSGIPFVTPDGTVLRSSGGSLCASHPDGTDRWRTPFSQGSYGFPPVVAENLLYTTLSDRLAVLDARTGKQVALSESAGEARFFQDRGSVYLKVGDQITRFSRADLAPGRLESSGLGTPMAIEVKDGFVSVGGVRLKSRQI